MTTTSVILVLLILTAFCQRASSATVTSSVFECEDLGGDSDMTDYERQIFQDWHNQHRENLVSGHEPGRCGTLATCQNVYHLKYDCSLEKQAFAKASQCALGPRNSTAKHGELVFYYSPVDATELTNVEVILKALEFFFGDVAQVDGVRDGRTRAGQVLFGRATALGCAVQKCAGSFTGTEVVCHYLANSFPENQICEAGSACKVDADCTTYANSLCDTKTGLCRTDTPVPPGEAKRKRSADVILQA